MLILWILIFVVSLAFMLKGADWMLLSAERIGLSFGLSSFVVGVIIVGLGTSLPELVSSLFAVIGGQPEIVPANAIGSNVANILLVVGLTAVVGTKMVVPKNLIDLDLPLLAISTFIFVAAAYDGLITRWESFLLLTAFAVFVAYTVNHKEERQLPELDLVVDNSDDHIDIDGDGMVTKAEAAAEIISFKDWVKLVGGIALLIGGSKYLIDSVVNLASVLSIETGVVALIAVAIGTSLPELIVSVKAARSGSPEVALGNIFGSNAFNVLAVVGIPGLFASLPLDPPTLGIGLPALVIVTMLFVISGISRRIHNWEGFMMLILYIFFVVKLLDYCNWFSQCQVL